MYDVEKGIYPPGEYLVGEDITKGRYLLKAENDIGGSVSLYENYNKYKKDEMMAYNSFEKEYHLSLREDGVFISINGANIHRI